MASTSSTSRSRVSLLPWQCSVNTVLLNSVPSLDVRLALTAAPDWSMVVAHFLPAVGAATSEKVLKSARLEEVRLTILNMMLEYHPESSSQIAWAAAGSPLGSADGSPLGPRK